MRSGLVLGSNTAPAVAKFQQVYLEKIRVLTAGSWGVKTSLCLNNVAWNNRIRPRFYSVGLIEQQTSWLKRPKVRLRVWPWCPTVGSFLLDVRLSASVLLPGALKSQRLAGPVWLANQARKSVSLSVGPRPSKALLTRLAFQSTEAMVKRNSRGGISTAS